MIDWPASGDHSLIVSSQLPVANMSFEIRFQSQLYTSAWCSSHDISGKPGCCRSHNFTEPSPHVDTSWLSFISLQATSYWPSCDSNLRGGTGAA